MNIDHQKRRQFIKKSIEEIASFYGIEPEVLEQWESGVTAFPYPEILNLAMKYLEEQYDWQTKHSPHMQSICDKIEKSIRRSDAVLAGVPVEYDNTEETLFV